jgi:hypothetical protein
MELTSSVEPRLLDVGSPTRPFQRRAQRPVAWRLGKTVLRVDKALDGFKIRPLPRFSGVRGFAAWILD